MSLASLIYVSTSLIPSEDTSKALATILAGAREGNRQRELSGALMFTGNQFVQIIEGERATVDSLFQKIMRDPRHCDIVVLDDRAIDRRLFSNWSLAYAGNSIYVRNAISKPLAAALRGAEPDVRSIVRLMMQFCSSNDQSGPRHSETEN